MSFFTFVTVVDVVEYHVFNDDVFCNDLRLMNLFLNRFLLILIFFIPFEMFAQNWNNLHEKTFFFDDTIVLDSSFVMPNSVEIFAEGQRISDSLFWVDVKFSRVIFCCSDFEEVEIKYRTLNYDFNKKISSKDSSLIVSKLQNSENKRYSVSRNIDEILANDGLTKKGVVSRGIAMGNNQEPVVNSKLNLQLSGKLTNDLDIEAVISEESMPVQPDGNTAQIQDFSKVFIRVSGAKTQIVAGDFNLKEPESYFLNYNKQSKGIEFSTSDFKLTENVHLNKTQTGLAVAKGKYYRQTIKAVEGNQGPYRLQGANGETYIVVVAGSERVYIDGELLKRGENEDYTIGYNSAEIIFTPKQTIIKDTRIVVEFEYSERHYSRFTTFSNNFFSAGKTNFFFNVYSEIDAKNQTIDMDLTDEMKMILLGVGDSLDLAKIQNVDSVSFDSDMILYQKVDTVIDGQVFSYYEYSTNPLLANFNLSFAYVGENAGDYIIDQSQTNGRIYKWVIPENGVKQGSYDAVTIIVSPKKSQMFDFGIKFPIAQKAELNIEMALSNIDLNLFSNKDDNDNIGQALKLDFVNFFKGNDTISEKSKIWLDYEFAANNFHPVEVYKTQEFERDWNIDKPFLNDEHIAEIGYYSGNKKGHFSSQISSLYHKNEYFGINSAVDTKLADEKNDFDANGAFLYSDDNINFTNFARSFLQYKRKISKFTFGSFYRQETNTWNNKLTDSVLLNSYMFHTLSFFAQTADSSANLMKLSYKRRWDYLPFENNFKLSTFSNDFNFLSQIKRQAYNVNFLLNYRELYIVDSLLTNNKPENSLTGRIDLNFNLLNKALIFNIVGTISGGLEQKLQYIFIEVEPTKGVYVWIDYNEDGLKQIDEFEIASYSDLANYVRVPLQSNEYVKVYGKNITQTVVFNPLKLFKEETKIHKIASKINNSFAFNIEHKSYDFNLLDFTDTNVVKSNFYANNVLNLSCNKKLNFSYLWQKNKSIMLLVNGYELNQLRSKKVVGRYRFSGNLILTDELFFSQKNLESEFSLVRNYLIKENKNSLNLLFTNDNVDFSLQYSYSDKRNIKNTEVLLINTVTISSTVVFAKKNRVSAEINIIDNNFHGDVSTSVAYSMLEGLKPDFNLTWLINVKRNIGKTLQITFLYSGRYSQNSRLINTGSVNLVAFF
ncbi:MAG: hypothetical protein JXL97_03685 [Bacteroidales bacterium]|nr:hypothetical protein [Bacteroidales bacterium]